MNPPAAPVRVEWDRLRSPDLFEDMVSTLLSIQHPTAVRTDGSGGDGGKDVHFDDPVGLEIFELKSFTGRLKTARRTQVKKSFDRAMKLKPPTWALVVPIDPTDAEQTRFDALTTSVTTRCRWIGRTQLDAAMAQHACIPRYFLTDVADEIRDLTKLFQAETAALADGVTDALARIRAIADLCDGLDPFYRVDISFDSAAGTSTARLSPRYIGADRDRPITLQADFVFPNQDAADATLASLEATFYFGVPATVPAEYVRRVRVDAPAGFAQDLPECELHISAAELTDTPEFRLDLTIESPEGVRLAALPVTGRTQSVGAIGLTAELTDPARILSIEMRVDWSQQRLQLHYTVSGLAALPSLLTPSLRFLSALCAPNMLAVGLGGGIGTIASTPVPGGEPPVDAGWVRCVELLARVQDRTNTWFETPMSFSFVDRAELEVVDQLLAGEPVTGTWTRLELTMTTGNAREVLEEALRLAGGPDGAMSLWRVDELFFDLQGQHMPLGTTTTHFHSGRLINADEVAQRPADATDDATILLVYEPGTVDTLDRWRGQATERPTDGKTL